MATKTEKRTQLFFIVTSGRQSPVKGGKMGGGGGKIDRSMISGPQGEMRHTAHVGIDRTGQVSVFGDIPRQIVKPCKEWGLDFYALRSDPVHSALVHPLSL